jgi:hypothetical protein
MHFAVDEETRTPKKAEAKLQNADHKFTWLYLVGSKSN